MKPTNAFQKLFASVINAFVAIVVTLPLFYLWGLGLKWKLAVIVAFFIYEMIFLLRKDRRDLGMIVGKTFWKTPFSDSQYIFYNILYTLSFSTLFFNIIFPFDLLLINLLLIQLPLVVLTKTTLHGYLSGMMTLDSISR